MDIRARVVGHERLRDDECVVLSRQRLIKADFSGRRLVQFSSEGCSFEDCSFEGATIESASVGAGHRVSQYVRCRFDNATLRMVPGGYARFVDCTFEQTRIDSWFCFAVELVGCRFSGRLRKVVFNGTVPLSDRAVVGRQFNQFEGNDFLQADLQDVGFRTGIDLTKQLLPAGKEYTYFPDAAAALGRARQAFDSWTEQALKDAAVGVLKVMEGDVAAGQRQLLLRADSFAQRDREAIRKLLAAAGGHSTL